MDGCLPKGVVFSWSVGDARHKKPYPQGKKKQATPSWKRRVRERMMQLEISDAELARRLGADKAGLGRFLNTEQTSSKWVDAICAELGIPEPMIELVPDDEFQKFIAGLNPVEKRKALDILRIALSK
jgi:hypothetical protein